MISGCEFSNGSPKRAAPESDSISQSYDDLMVVRARQSFSDTSLEFQPQRFSAH
jgi:hypothetical protein